MPIARPAAEIEPDSPTSSSSLILPGPRAPLARSMRMVSRATPLAYHWRRLSEEDVVIGWDEGVPKRGTDPRAAMSSEPPNGGAPSHHSAAQSRSTMGIYSGESTNSSSHRRESP